MERMQTYGHPGSHYGPVPPQNPPPNGYNLATQPHQQQTPQQSSASTMPSQQQHPQQNPESPDNRDGPVTSSDKSSSTQTEPQPRPSQSSITSPAASPYPSANCSVTGMYKILYYILCCLNSMSNKPLGSLFSLNPNN